MSNADRISICKERKKRYYISDSGSVPYKKEGFCSSECHNKNNDRYALFDSFIVTLDDEQRRRMFKIFNNLDLPDKFTEYVWAIMEAVDYEP